MHHRNRDHGMDEESAAPAYHAVPQQQDEDVKESVDVKPASHGANTFLQYVAAISASLMMFASGTNFGWVAPTIPKLLSSDSPIPFTADQASWLASLLSVGAILGPVFGSIAADTLGRKTAILLTAAPFLFSWVLIGFATHVWMLLVARFLCGVAVGASFSIIPMYMGEIATDRIRGTLGTFISISINMGILLEFAVAPYVTISINALIGACIPVIMLITFSRMPESPYYLLNKKRDEHARQALCRLRGTDQVDKELAIIQNVLQKQKEEEGSAFDLVSVKSNRKALLIVIGLVTAQQASGISAIMAYAHVLFEQSGSTLSPAVSGIVLASISLGIVVICAFLVDTLGRRPLLILSSLSTAVPLCLIGMFFYLKSIDYKHMDSIALLPMVALIIFKLTIGIGIAGLPYIVLGEVFPTNVKAYATCIVSIYGSVCGFIVAKLYQVMADTFGTHTVFFAFAVGCIMSAVFIMICLPETKGKPLHEIQEMFKSDSGQQKTKK